MLVSNLKNLIGSDLANALIGFISHLSEEERKLVVIYNGGSERDNHFMVNKLDMDTVIYIELKNMSFHREDAAEIAFSITSKDHLDEFIAVLKRVYDKSLALEKEQNDVSKKRRIVMNICEREFDVD